MSETIDHDAAKRIAECCNTADPFHPDGARRARPDEVWLLARAYLALGTVLDQMKARIAELEAERDEARRFAHATALEAGERNAELRERIGALGAERNAWRHVAVYYLGDYADAHTAQECRAEAVRRTLTDEAPEPDPIVESMGLRIGELEAEVARLNQMVEVYRGERDIFHDQEARQRRPSFAAREFADVLRDDAAPESVREMAQRLGFKEPTQAQQDENLRRNVESQFAPACVVHAFTGGVCVACGVADGEGGGTNEGRCP